VEINASKERREIARSQGVESTRRRERKESRDNASFSPLVGAELISMRWEGVEGDTMSRQATKKREREREREGRR
jgi:hypothetical protein